MEYFCTIIFIQSEYIFYIFMKNKILFELILVRNQNRYSLDWLMSLQIKEARKVQNFSFSYIIKIATIYLLGLELDKAKREMMLLYWGSISAVSDEIALTA